MFSLLVHGDPCTIFKCIQTNCSYYILLFRESIDNRTIRNSIVIHLRYKHGLFLHATCFPLTFILYHHSERFRNFWTLLKDLQGYKLPFSTLLWQLKWFLCMYLLLVTAFQYANEYWCHVLKRSTTLVSRRSHEFSAYIFVLRLALLTKAIISTWRYFNRLYAYIYRAFQLSSDNHFSRNFIIS